MTQGILHTHVIDFTVFQFSGLGESWWTTLIRSRRANLPPLTWTQFVALFMDRFLPPSQRDALRDQFEKLHQNDMTVA